ncbi:MAG: PEP-CTERM sorting domain-containing protein, partial [Verrucomicrobiae bacterium]|nr:PEP-CTERM sorting domain-containing protein [Verrucomicrobiae bacterium]
MVIQFKGGNANRSADVTFSQTAPGQNLVVTLANDYPGDVLVPSDVLTAVFFKLPGNPTLTRISAVVPSGNTVLFGPTDPGGVIGGEWAYRNNINGPGAANQGISSAGFGIFGPANLFPGSNL